MCCILLLALNNMLSKALLLLAVCFQALRTGNSVESVEEIKDGFQKGKSVSVHIQPHDYPRPDCKILLQETKEGDTGDKLLISFIGSKRQFLINAYANGQWKEEDNEYNIDIYQPIDTEIMADENSFIITFKGKQYFREYDFPSKKIKYMKVECPKEGKMDVKPKWRKECTCQAKK